MSGFDFISTGPNKSRIRLLDIWSLRQEYEAGCMKWIKDFVWVYISLSGDKNIEKWLFIERHC